MTGHQPALEVLGDHDYPVRFQQDEDTVVVRVHADPAVVSASPTTSSASSRRPRPT